MMGMRKSFDQSVPLHEQISRITKTQTGRKHQHRIGPGRKQPQKLSAMALKKQRAFRAKVRAYWAGEVDEFPLTPPARRGEQ